MTNRCAVFFMIAVCVPGLGGTAVAGEALSNLIEVGKAQQEIQNSYKEETGAYKSIKRAYDNGSLKKGMTKREVSSRYGNPVVSYNDYSTKKEKWVYKPAATDFLAGGARLSLFFDSQGILDEIQVSEK